MTFSQLNAQAESLTWIKRLLLLSLLGLLTCAVGVLVMHRKYKLSKRARKTAETASRVKGQFLNLIGHSARSTLNAVESMVQSLKSSSVSLEHLPTVQIIGTQAASLNKSITDFIFSARMLSGDRNAQENLFNPHEYRNKMLPVWKSSIGKRNVTVEFDIASDVPLFFVDKLYLQTAVNHLVEEALPRTRRGSVNISFAQEQSLRGQVLAVTIEDTGEGMTELELESLAEFFEVDEHGISITDMNQTLGFSVARSAVEAMGGRLNLTSQAGAGTSASFSIPIKRAAANDMGVKSKIGERA